ncbi:iron ABC transporter permease [Oerskovia turbata]|uniref:Iron ABC transporter permease n=1 Tax=Oerskovia turbata TaxID=1713 RepID=A0A4Q1L1U7_9CELL|nr:iron ABC transporter permease [Oerskovia turbata]RXR26935.1 iron ABC transporter permease [Oerskovia turbata]RXR36223.1 iron ABC transporter permease [Oerskovia turbata]
MTAPRTGRRPGGRLPLVGAALVLALLGAVAASIAFGSQPVPLPDVLAVLRARGTSEASAIVWDMRVPRTVLGLLVGIALGVAGALTQAHTRNPLADPGLLGVTSGAACAVVLAIHAGVTSPSGAVGFALVGALCAGGIVVVLSQRIRILAPGVTLVLTGSIVTALLASITSGVLLLDRATMDVFRFWSIGSLVGRGPEVIWTVAPFLLLGLVLAVVNAPTLGALEMGDQLGVTLGRPVVRDRVVGLLAVTLLAGAATAACGSIAFVGLAATHAASRLGLGGPGWRVPVAGLCGAVLVLGADVVGRLAPATSEIQVGIVIALVGAPLFVVLARGYLGDRS